VTPSGLRSIRKPVSFVALSVQARAIRPIVVVLVVPAAVAAPDRQDERGDEGESTPVR
jgi:hypothetical protein